MRFILKSQFFVVKRQSGLTARLPASEYRTAESLTRGA